MNIHKSLHGHCPQLAKSYDGMILSVYLWNDIKMLYKIDCYVLIKLIFGKKKKETSKAC